MPWWAWLPLIVLAVLVIGVGSMILGAILMVIRSFTHPDYFKSKRETAHPDVLSDGYEATASFASEGED